MLSNKNKEGEIVDKNKKKNDIYRNILKRNEIQEDFIQLNEKLLDKNKRRIVNLYALKDYLVKNNAAAPRTPPESPCLAFLIGGTFAVRIKWGGKAFGKASYK